MQKVLSTNRNLRVFASLQGLKEAKPQVAIRRTELNNMSKEELIQALMKQNLQNASAVTAAPPLDFVYSQRTTNVDDVASTQFGLAPNSMPKSTVVNNDLTFKPDQPPGLSHQTPPKVGTYEHINYHSKLKCYFVLGSRKTRERILLLPKSRRMAVSRFASK